MRTCSSCPPLGITRVDARRYAHGLRIIAVKTFPQALHALATLPAEALKTARFGGFEPAGKWSVFVCDNAFPRTGQDYDRS